MNTRHTTLRPIQAHLFRAICLVILCAALAGCSSVTTNSKSGTGVNLYWDWSGIIGTGQSLSVGARGVPVLSTNQPYHNLKLSTDHLRWPINPNDPHLTLAPLVEPVGRLARWGPPSSWPVNIYGETPHSAMANEITALVRANTGRDFVSIHCAVGEGGQGMVCLEKNAVKRGVNGRSYEAAMIATKAIARLAKAAGKTCGVGAIIVTHGETDANNADYESELRQLWSDYNTDVRAITGQKQKIQMIVSQQNSCADRSASTLAQWKIGVNYPEDIVCSGPKYQYPYAPDCIHLTADGYRQLGEKYGQIYYQRVILNKNWQPLEPVNIERRGRTITVQYHVPVPPLVWATNFELPHQSTAEWRNGKGFEVCSAGGDKVAVASVVISGDAVVIACASDPGPGAQVGYAMTGEKPRMATPFPGTFRWGLLRDSDPFVGAATGLAQPNYSVAFEMSAP
ncbi:MAG TPA: sialate O-acetylesterase [Candidatus Sulfotelmatobacter sp.]|nr:sialate O-acetylesterase [Candidatus Sulfotelmatobacter sp.]